MIDISNLRREFSFKVLNEKDISPNPMEQFERWLKEAIEVKALEPNAMNLATVGLDGKPSSRIVLLKQIKQDGLIFFSNYESKKASQIEQNHFCALNFMWHELERQVRIEGTVNKLSDPDSDSYFKIRPAASKIGAWASPQSKTISGREYLDELVTKYELKFDSQNIERPPYWGGYIVKPVLFEFWQGRKNRLHDRIQYKHTDEKWSIERLAP